MSVVRVRESPYYRGFFCKKIYENFVGTLETVRNREVRLYFFPAFSKITHPHVAYLNPFRPTTRKR